MSLLRPSVRALSGAALALSAAGLAAAPPASAAGPVALWQMDEPAGATRMVDTSGHGHTGAIGSVVRPATALEGERGYFFPLTSNGSGTADRQRLVVVPDAPGLDPGTGTYTVTVSVRFGPAANYRNLLQKGQSGQAGGYYKLEVDGGAVRCVFRGSAGQAGVSTGALDDKHFHTLVCRRTSSGVTISVDGRQVGSRTAPTGSIANSAPLVVGGKYSCDVVHVECDYFTGTVQKLQIG